MIVDSSAILAVLFGEPERDAFVDLLIDRDARMSAASLTEAGIVADQRSPRLGRALDALVDQFDITVEPVTRRHAQLARTAYRRYGRGTGSPARLNFGDCLTYALASEAGESLLFKGDDFTHTDLLFAHEGY
ncbi:MAG: type II toxin-antitoxin system VapC family toxin [Dermatophilus congolensis]|nr:type II toxin-antitoxin system VapC family toxin [Dermatophilus congolensis]